MGFLYRKNPNINIFGNISDGFYFPQIRTIQFNEIQEPNSFEEERLLLSEAGIKYKLNDIRATASLMFSELQDRRLYTFINAPDGGIREQIDKIATQAIGLQSILHWQISPIWQLQWHFTYQDMKFTEFDREPSFIGNRPVRTAKFSWDAQLGYQYGPWYGVFGNTYLSDTYANNANTIRLDSFHLSSLSLGYEFRKISGLRAQFSVFNLFNSQGITEGSPRQGDSQTLEDYFIGRPVLPRRFSFSLLYEF